MSKPKTSLVISYSPILQQLSDLYVLMRSDLHTVDIPHTIRCASRAPSIISNPTGPVLPRWPRVPSLLILARQGEHLSCSPCACNGAFGQLAMPPAPIALAVMHTGTMEPFTSHDPERYRMIGRSCMDASASPAMPTNNRKHAHLRMQLRDMPSILWSVAFSYLPDRSTTPMMYRRRKGRLVGYRRALMARKSTYTLHATSSSPYMARRAYEVVLIPQATPTSLVIQ